LYKQFSTVFFAVLLTVASTMPGSVLAAETGYYKWTDEKGNPHHSDRPPPPGMEYTFIGKESGLRRRVTAEESREQAQPSTPVGGTPTKAGRKGAELPSGVEKDPALCDRARANLDSLDSSARVRIRDSDGAVRYLTEEEKTSQRQRALKLIALHCN
jgi:hypothetical protein